MVVADDPAGPLQERDPAQDLPANDGVAIHQGALGLAERRGLVEDPVGDGHLAHVVEQVAELGLRLAGQLGLDPDRQLEAVGRHALGVLSGVGVAGLHRVG